MQRNKNKRFDLLLMLAAPLVATAVTILFNTSQVVSLILFFIVPSIYITYRTPSVFKKAIIFVLASIPFTIIVDYFAIQDGSWWVYTIFPFRLLNGIPMEDFIWSASWFYFVIAFYEYFIDQPNGAKDAPLNNRYKEMVWGWVRAGAVFLLLYFTFDRLITIPYFYAVFAIGLGIIPLVLFLIRKPRMLHKFSLVVIYFFGVNFLHEISALSTNQWYFPGEHFIGWVQIFHFTFPFEEFVLWMLLGSMYVLTWYEHFEDDEK